MQAMRLGEAGRVTALRVEEIPPITAYEAGVLAAAEYDRFARLLRDLQDVDWSRPTDCQGWDVRRLAAHVLGATEANAHPVEMARQLRRGRAGLAFAVDPVSAYQVSCREGLDPTELIARFEAAAGLAVRWRGRMATWARMIPVRIGEPVYETWRLGFLAGTIYTRDTWMHRIDICRATGRSPLLTAAHDGRIVADIVAEWVRRHRRPVRLSLTGPAGGEFEHRREEEREGEGGRESLTADAVEFCRAVSGRGEPPLATPVPF
ncbi:maleylpyruvate isomerase family mycothiol-dependent enzyme [Parafrankia elaeagni]|uniref:maleylpyruvate isomerase family mycothiol-dependent enzyme n=1 Tax=Parafrankia elaeagni TaxID=222534 RepID=UPI000372093A|nr:maleylpyruvate isomerase family mycothiol-dependent enzyme [Parafrankia elaeagni]